MNKHKLYNCSVKVGAAAEISEEQKSLRCLASM